MNLEPIVSRLIFIPLPTPEFWATGIYKGKNFFINKFVCALIHFKIVKAQMTITLAKLIHNIWSNGGGGLLDVF